MRKKGKEKQLDSAGKIIFFLNAFIAFLIITGAWFLAKTEFGKTAMIFGFVMLALSTTLKFVNGW
jgi:hypothetical protein